MLLQFAALLKIPILQTPQKGVTVSCFCVIIYRSGNDFPLGLMTVLVSGELVSLSNTADVFSGTFSILASTTGGTSQSFQRHLRYENPRAGKVREKEGVISFICF